MKKKSSLIREGKITFAEEFKSIERICKEEKSIANEIHSNLNCFYLNTTEIPFLRLTRVKVEEVYERPQIVLIHKFLSEKETELIKNLSKPHLKHWSFDKKIKRIISHFSKFPILFKPKRIHSKTITKPSPCLYLLINKYTVLPIPGDFFLHSPHKPMITTSLIVL